MRTPTLKDIALQAEVSTATVSLVLNNRPGVKQETRNQVLEIARELNYTSSGSSKNKNHPFPICFMKIAIHGNVVNNEHKGFIADYIDGIEIESRKEGYSLEVRTFDSFSSTEIENEVYRRKYSGLIILATELNEQQILTFKTLDIPKIFIDASYPFHSFDFVNMDNQSAIYTVMKTFKNAGIDTVGLIHSTVETRNFSLRSQFFEEAVKYFHMSTKPQWKLSVGPSFEEAYVSTRRYLQTQTDLPKGFFAVCDTIGIGAIKAFKECGISVPETVSIFGFDDLELCTMMHPTLSSVRVSKVLMGRRAFQSLHRKLQNEKRSTSEKIYIGCEIICRESIITP